MAVGILDLPIVTGVCSGGAQDSVTFAFIVCCGRRSRRPSVHVSVRWKVLPGRVRQAHCKRGACVSSRVVHRVRVHVRETSTSTSECVLIELFRVQTYNPAQHCSAKLSTVVAGREVLPL